MRNNVIIFARSEDVHAQSVSREIEALGGRAIIIDTADYPSCWNLTLLYDGNHIFNYLLKIGDEVIDSDSVAGVWWRRVYRHHVSDEIRDIKIQQFCLDESRSAFQGWVYSLGSSVINPLKAEMSVQKPFQLYTAASVGLEIPRTLITNSASDARSFYENEKSGAIFKILTTTDWQFTETRDLLPDYLEQLKNLRLAPVIFQEKIQAVEDIRATVVDDEIFTVSIRPHHPGARIDWRLDLAAEIQPHQLPEEIKEKLLKLHRALGLRYGAVDLRLTPEGRYVFLEVNTGGQFLFVEIHGEQPISRAIARALLFQRTE